MKKVKVNYTIINVVKLNININLIKLLCFSWICTDHINTANITTNIIIIIIIIIISVSYKMSAQLSATFEKFKILNNITLSP